MTDLRDYVDDKKYTPHTLELDSEGWPSDETAKEALLEDELERFLKGPVEFFSGIIDNPEKWTKGQLAVDEYGIPTPVTDEKAVKFCAMGAIKLMREKFNKNDPEVKRHRPDTPIFDSPSNVTRYLYWCMDDYSKDMKPELSFKAYVKFCEDHNVDEPSFNLINNYIEFFNDHENTTHEDIKNLIVRAKLPEKVRQFYSEATAMDIYKMWGNNHRYFGGPIPKSKDIRDYETA